MAQISEEEVKHLAELARLNLSENEVKKYSKELSSILDYVSLLEEVDTKDVKPTFQVTGLENVTRKDEVRKVCDRDAALLNTPLQVSRDQIKVPPVFE